ncbi:hypothetical protein MNBD_GAMMA20-955 [hydrothermal vent metagenome]|uniref:Uncharacterized protein n=1 Tax=hydrothermal vent metagenome TaxID=652676 RepID=A0A3B1A188_9ZZZZ
MRRGLAMNVGLHFLLRCYNARTLSSLPGFRKLNPGHLFVGSMTL